MVVCPRCGQEYVLAYSDDEWNRLTRWLAVARCARTTSGGTRRPRSRWRGIRCGGGKPYCCMDSVSVPAGSFASTDIFSTSDRQMRSNCASIVRAQNSTAVESV
jgi:hypothetical protein